MLLVVAMDNNDIEYRYREKTIDQPLIWLRAACCLNTTPQYRGDE